MQPTNPELRRFLSMYDQQVRHTADLVASLSPDDYAAVPVDTEQMFLGTRVNKITIGNLLRHLIVAEAHWFEQLATIEPGEVMPLPVNAAVIQGLPDGPPLVERLIEIARQGRERAAQFSDEDLAKTFSFVGQRFTVMGFLWMLYGHQAYHKGQIDQLMRSVGILPIEYLEYQPTAELIG